MERLISLLQKMIVPKIEAQIIRAVKAAGDELLISCVGSIGTTDLAARYATNEHETRDNSFAYQGRPNGIRLHFLVFYA